MERGAHEGGGRQGGVGGRGGEERGRGRGWSRGGDGGQYYQSQQQQWGPQGLRARGFEGGSRGGAWGGRGAWKPVNIGRGDQHYQNQQGQPQSQCWAAVPSGSSGGSSIGRGAAWGGRGGRGPAHHSTSVAIAESQISSLEPVSVGGSGRGSAWGGQGSAKLPQQSTPAAASGPLGSSFKSITIEGSDSDSARGRQGSVELAQQSHPAAPSDSLGSSFKSTSIDDGAKRGSKLVPVKRPDQGGQFKKQTVNLSVNHFLVKFNPESTIIHYAIDIKPDEALQKGRSVKMSKAELSMIRNKLFLDHPAEFALSMTAYDGEKDIYSAVPLPTGVFKVQLPESENRRSRSYTVTIECKNELKLSKLRRYIRGAVSIIPRDILQGMDVVFKDNPARHLLSVGRGFYPTDPSDERVRSINDELIASRGFQHSLKPTIQGLSLCLDYSVLAFRRQLPVIEFLKKRIRHFDITNFQRFRKQAEDALKGLKVTVTHRKTKQKYTVTGLSPRITQHVTFPLEDSQGNALGDVYLVHYFKEKYGKDIVYKDIPCLGLGNKNRANFVPMEFCELIEGQRYPKEHLDKYTSRELKSLSMPKPSERKEQIISMVRGRDGPCGGDITRNFGFDVNMTMTTVTGRVICPPELRLGDRYGKVRRITVHPVKCDWNLANNSVVEGTTISRWAMLEFSNSGNSELRKNLCGMLIDRCQKLGIHMEKPLLSEFKFLGLLSDVNELYKVLTSIKDKAYKNSQGDLQLLFCVMPEKHAGYKYLKWLSDTKVGVVTQCCLSSTVNNNNRPDQYLANLALKINAKLGGSNVELNDQFPYFNAEDRVMFVGADVNHPSPQNTSSPSIAAVVGTMNWPSANRYAARVRPQAHRKEMILEFAEMCRELVESYEQINKQKPTRIVIFRDGVSESQFDKVLNEEFIDLREEFRKAEYNPSITLIVAQKRHQTRLFPDKDGGWEIQNVHPGTVVDTTIVHPFEFDFYLCSHHGSIGTSKPTHYYVLYDEHNFRSDELQQLIYFLCFTFARSTKPVSLVPPVYYADLVAYRGRLYYEAVEKGEFSAPTTSSASSSALPPNPLSDARSFYLHKDLENIMFFV